MDARISGWLEWGRTHRRWAETTRAGYRRRITAYLDWCHDQHLRQDRARTADVQAWLDTLLPSPAVHAQALCAVIAWYDWQRMDRNPARAIPRPPRRKPVPRSLDVDAARHVIATAQAFGPKWAAYIGLLMYAGLRRFEACKVRWVDIEGDAWLRVVGKGGQEKVVPVHDNLRRLIVRLRSSEPHPTWLFPGRHPGDCMSVATATKWTRQILDAAGLPGVTGHQARHSYGTRLIELGVDVTVVKEALRHESLSSTNIYTLARPVRVAAAVAQLDY